jgi:peptide deformylase
MVRKIIKYGDPLLEQKSEPVTQFDTPGLRETIADMFETMYAAKGVGLAAPQIGMSVAAAVVRPPERSAEPVVLLNPRVLGESRDTDEQYEGCLSFFDVRGMVQRPLWVEVESLLPNGARVINRYERGPARLVQHEIDHLAGRLYLDRMPPGTPLVPVEEYHETGRPWRYV